MKPYDYMALVPIVTGAGGVMTDWQVRAGLCAAMPALLLTYVPAPHAWEHGHGLRSASVIICMQGGELVWRQTPSHEYTLDGLPGA